MTTGVRPPSTQELVGQIYDAVTEPDKWNLFLDNLATAMGAVGARLRMADSGGSRYQLLAGSGYDEAYDERYRCYYSKVDIWNPFLAALDPGVVVTGEQCISTRDFITTEIYNDFFREYDVQYGLGGNIARTDEVLARIGVHRSRSQGNFVEEDFRFLGSLMPHVQRAFELGRYFDSTQSRLGGMQEALHLSSIPVILIDENENIAYLNPVAESILGNDSGLTVFANRLTTESGTERDTLRSLLQEAIATGINKGTGEGGAMGVTNREGERRYNLLVSPCAEGSSLYLGAGKRICAIVFVHDAKKIGRLPVDVLKKLYGLTRAEVRLADKIVAGKSPAEAAQELGLSVNTVRSQLRSLFAKTETQRQPELVRVLLGLSI